MAASRRLQAGMTMLEVLVALLIFSFGFLGLIGMQARAIQVSTDAEDRSRAALIANEIISAMWIQKTLTPPAPMVAAWQARVADPMVAGLPRAQGTLDAPVAGAVKVTITWHATSRNGTLQDSQYVTQVMMP